MLKDRRIVLGISGSIACYKAADIASKLTQAGAVVDALLSPSATRFITPLAIRSITRRPVFVDMFDPESELAEEHVELARSADAVLVAPASANTIARIAHGLADEMISLTVLATAAPVLVAPAMDAQMWSNGATRANVDLLRARGIAFVGPAQGRLASGRTGEGRLESTENILGALSQLLGRGGDLAGRRLLVSAGGTQEPIDPVRYIGNHSSGKMGYAIAEAARDRGADVALISTPTSLGAPYGVRLIAVDTAAEMCRAVLDEAARADVLVMAAAVADFRPTARAEQKIKKGDSGITLELTRTEDILQEVQRAGLPLVRVGFAAESEDLLEHAGDKLRRKGLHLIAANDITATDAGFGTDTNRVVLLDAQGGIEHLPLLPKSDVAMCLLDRVAALLHAREPA
ncbi:MAG: bifunctional phosphopantothenoylcysteine decarboxylase/phosphopantothenate--cysteine ligase CoaBC [Dehalococcoidia bacterium]